MNLDLIRNIDVEQNIIGSMIIDKKSILAAINKKVIADDFYEERHKVIFMAIIQVFKENNKIDLILLTDYLKNKEQITQAGGITYISELSASIPSTSNIGNYIDILLKYSCKRKILGISNYINTNENVDVETLKGEIHKKVLDLFDAQKKGNQEMQEVGENFLMNLQKRATGEITGLKTGLNALDDNIGGLYPAELITIFAFSSVGKTALALQIAINIMQQKKKVLYFSLEMPGDQILERLNANICSINSKDLRNGNLKASEWSQVTEATGYLCSNNRITISDESNLEEIIARIQLEKLKNDIDIVFVDYIGLIEAPKEERRDLQIANITRKFKLLALNLNIPIVILAQAKQSTNDKNSDRYKVYEKISETDIGESGAIYKDSDKCIAMFRNIELDDQMARAEAAKEDKLNYNSKDATYNPNCVNLLIKKCRNGSKGTLAFQWEGKYYRVSNYER